MFQFSKTKQSERIQTLKNDPLVWLYVFLISIIFVFLSYTSTGIISAAFDSDFAAAETGITCGQYNTHFF